MRQQQREFNQFDLGLERLEKQEAGFNARGYATAGPLVSRIVWQAIDDYAKCIEAEFERRTKLPASVSSQADAAFIALVAQYMVIKPLSHETLQAPQLGFKLIAACVWKTICDHAMTPGSLVRIKLKTDVGELLEFQAENRYWKSVRSKITNEDLRSHLAMIDSKLNDVEATLDVRLKRAKGLYKEVHKGRIVRKRGPKTSKVLYVPDGVMFERWDDRFRELASNELVDLLACPKSGPTGPDDSRPFQIVDSESRSDAADRIEVRHHFRESLENIKHQMSQYLLDFRPLIEPPKDWTEVEVVGTKNNTGGYHLEDVRQLTPLIRFGQGQCDTTPSKLAIHLCNKVQQTEWRIDPEQLEIIRRISMEWETSYDGIVRPRPYTREDVQKATGAAALLPEVQNRDNWRERAYQLSDKAKVLAEQGLELHDAEKQFLANWAYNQAALRQIYREIAVSGKQVSSLITTLTRMMRESKEQSLYYAWNMDYRGRYYPIISTCSPQGPAAERFTLELAKGERLSPDGVNCALRAIGTAAIDSKVSVNDRIKWATDNIDLVRMIGEGTDAAIIQAKDCDSPLELLSLCRAWVKHEEGEPWHKLVYQDATNSGWAIVSALLNETDGLIATNVCTSTYDQAPNDAYSLAREQEVDLLTHHYKELTGHVKPTLAERDVLLELLTDKKLGRAINKAFATTAIYGSGKYTWMDDIEEVLNKNGLGDREVSPKLRSKLAQLVEVGFKEVLSAVLDYNKAIKKMARTRLFMGVDPVVQEEIIKLGSLRNSRHQKGKELSQGQMTQYLELGRLVHKQSTYGLNFVAPDGMFVDLRRYIRYSEQFQTVFHGKPTLLITDPEALDIQKMLQSAAPAIIHNLDSLVLKYAYSDVDYEVSLIHDSVGVHPNYMLDAASDFRMGLLKATEPGYLEGLANQWGTVLELPVGTDTSWRDNPDGWVNTFN